MDTTSAVEGGRGEGSVNMSTEIPTRALAAAPQSPAADIAHQVATHHPKEGGTPTTALTGDVAVKQLDHQTEKKAMGSPSEISTQQGVAAASTFCGDSSRSSLETQGDAGWSGNEAAATVLLSAPAEQWEAGSEQWDRTTNAGIVSPPPTPVVVDTEKDSGQARQLAERDLAAGKNQYTDFDALERGEMTNLQQRQRTGSFSDTCRWYARQYLGDNIEETVEEWLWAIIEGCVNCKDIAVESLMEIQGQGEGAGPLDGILGGGKESKQAAAPPPIFQVVNTPAGPYMRKIPFALQDVAREQGLLTSDSEDEETQLRFQRDAELQTRRSPYGASYVRETRSSRGGEGCLFGSGWVM